MCKGAVAVQKKKKGDGMPPAARCGDSGANSEEESPQPGFGGLRVGLSAAVQVLISCRVQGGRRLLTVCRVDGKGRAEEGYGLG